MQSIKDAKSISKIFYLFDINFLKGKTIEMNVYLKSITGFGYVVDTRITWADFICEHSLPEIKNNSQAIHLKIIIFIRTLKAATGGLLGLGFGFSIISAAEVLYFLFIRWIYYWNSARNEKSQRQQTVATVQVAPVRPFIQPQYNGWMTEKNTNGRTSTQKTTRINRSKRKSF